MEELVFICGMEKREMRKWLSERTIEGTACVHDKFDPRRFVRIEVNGNPSKNEEGTKRNGEGNKECDVLIVKRRKKVMYDRARGYHPRLYSFLPSLHDFGVVGVSRTVAEQDEELKTDYEEEMENHSDPTCFNRLIAQATYRIGILYDIDIYKKIMGMWSFNLTLLVSQLDDLGKEYDRSDDPDSAKAFRDAAKSVSRIQGGFAYLARIGDHLDDEWLNRIDDHLINNLYGAIFSIQLKDLKATFKRFSTPEISQLVKRERDFFNSASKEIQELILHLEMVEEYPLAFAIETFGRGPESHRRYGKKFS